MDPVEASLEFCHTCEKFHISNPVFELWYCLRLKSLAFRTSDRIMWQIYTSFFPVALRVFISNIEEAMNPKFPIPKGWA
jgi:hypothetical protein